MQGGATRLLHEFPCKQHADFKNARYSRKHINLLLLDNCDEYLKTYGADGRPLEHATITAALQSRAAKYEALKANASEQAVAVGASQRSKDLWQCSYAEGGQQAADSWKQVGSRRTPIGTFFGLGNPALPREKDIPNKVPNMRPKSLTEVCNGPTHPLNGVLRSQPQTLGSLQEVISGACKDVQILDVSKHRNSGADAAVQGTTEAPRPEHTYKKPQPWLMPHQLGDRNMGKKIAKSINASRSPNGNFSIFDLPPKF